MKAFSSVNSSVRKAVLAANGLYKPKSNMFCRVGKVYTRQCKPGVVCNPVEGSFVTECENCKNFE